MPSPVIPALGTLRQDRIQDVEFKTSPRYMRSYLKNKKRGQGERRTLRIEEKEGGIINNNNNNNNKVTVLHDKAEKNVSSITCRSCPPHTLLSLRMLRKLFSISICHTSFLYYKGNQIAYLIGLIQGLRVFMKRNPQCLPYDQP